MWGPWCRCRVCGVWVVGCPCADEALPQVFFDLMREIRSRKSDDSRATNGDVKGKRRRRIKCAIL